MLQLPTQMADLRTGNVVSRGVEVGPAPEHVTGYVVLT